jgi:DUF4097 and DUF4098 domain-containing protein YvlB
MAQPRTTFPVDGPISLQVRLGHGRITICARDGISEAVVRLTPREADSDIVDRIAVERRESVIVVVGPHQGGLPDLIGRRRNREIVDADIDVPAGTPVKIASASEEISLVGRLGDTDIATASPRIEIDTVDGDLRLRYGAAEAHTNTVTGSVRLAAGSGTASFGDVRRNLESRVGSGEVTVDTVGGDVRSRAGSGAFRVGEARGDVDVLSGSGPIEIGLAAGVVARVDVMTGSGQVFSELPVDTTPASGVRQVRLRARTGSGDVRISRASAAA